MGSRPIQIVFAKRREPKKKNKEKDKERSREHRDSDPLEEQECETGEQTDLKETVEQSNSEDDYEALTAKQGIDGAVAAVRGNRRNKRKTERGDAKYNTGRVVVISNLPEGKVLKKLKKECEKFGQVESLEFPIPEGEIPSAYVTFSTHKEARLAVQQINGQTLRLGDAESAVSAQLLSREGKAVSKKSLKKSRLIVRNLSFKCSEADVRKVFEKYGELLEVHIPRKPNGHMLGYAYCTWKECQVCMHVYHVLNVY